MKSPRNTPIFSGAHVDGAEAAGPTSLDAIVAPPRIDL